MGILSAGLTRSDVERAINALELMLSCVNIYNDQREINAIKTSIKLCHAELKRQENAPMMCDGCKREEVYKELDGEDKILITCLKCARSKKTDRYEPKGEPNV